MCFIEFFWTEAGSECPQTLGATVTLFEQPQKSFIHDFSYYTECLI